MAETKRKIRLQFLAHLRLSLFLGSAKRLSHGLIQKVKSPSVAALKAWNNLPLHVRAAKYTDTFKRRPKTFSFCKFYPLPLPADLI